ncbi:hypothetical protein D3C84_845900 [compost metagenome]
MLLQISDIGDAAARPFVPDLFVKYSSIKSTVPWGRDQYSLQWADLLESHKAQALVWDRNHPMVDKSQHHVVEVFEVKWMLAILELVKVHNDKLIRIFRKKSI